MSRPTKLSQEVSDQMCLLIRAGNYIETAAAFAGISKDTLYRWLRDGKRAKSGVKRSFSDAVERALAEAEIRDVQRVAKASERQWQAAAWRLERKFPDRWGRRDTLKQEVSGPEGAPVPVNVKSELMVLPNGPEKLAHAYKEKLRRELLAEMAQQKA